jgi:NNMT/PNMT/TEMT family
MIEGTSSAKVGWPCLRPSGEQRPPTNITGPAVGDFAPSNAGWAQDASSVSSKPGKPASLGVGDALRLPSMADATCVHNAEVLWDDFSSDDYHRHNYSEMQPEDREIINRVCHFFIRAFASRDRAELAIDVGSGSNLYPALLMLPWTNHLLLTDYSAANVEWLRNEVMNANISWDWRPFWQEMSQRTGYGQISEPRKRLREMCMGEPGRTGIEQRSVFDLPRRQWQLGTMFFVAESITQDPDEFRAAVNGFIHALQPGAPFAAAFMAGSVGYSVAGVPFPALQITPNDVTERFSELGVHGLNVYLNQTQQRVRQGYSGMIVATGIVGER